MKENVLDVLMYLFETYVETEEESEHDQYELREELVRAGFQNSEIEHALDWLDGLGVDNQLTVSGSQTEQALRIYVDAEIERLDAGCRGYIVYLEQIGILTPVQRELVVDRLLALEAADIDVEHVKWVVLMVLFSQPGQELAYARMEDLVFDENEGLVH